MANAKKSKKNLWIGLGALVIVIAAAAIILGVTNNKQKVEVIRVGATAPGHLPFVLNRELGYWKEEFEKEGITVEFSTFSNGGSEVMTALANGNIDLAYTGADPALRSAAAGVDAVLVGFSEYNKNNGAGSIVVKEDSSIQSVKDLKGKKIAFLSGTVRHATLAKALSAEGLSLEEVEGLNIPFESSGPALLRGDIDAIVEMTATLNPLIKTGSARLILDGREHPEWTVPYTITANGEFARKHPDLIKKFLKSAVKISQWANENYDEAIKTFADGTDQEVEAVAGNYPEKVFYQDPKITQEGIDALKDEESFLAAAKLAEGAVDYEKWVQSSFIDEVYKELK